MPISSYIVRYQKEHQFALLSRLCSMPGVVVGELANGAFPVAVDTPSHTEAKAVGEQLEKLPGVRSAVLVYHNFEDQDFEEKESHENQSS